MLYCRIDIESEDVRTIFFSSFVLAGGIVADEEIVGLGIEASLDGDEAGGRL